MKKLHLFCATVLCLFASPLTTVIGSAQSPHTPTSIKPSADETLALTLTGRGVQIYKYSAVPGVANKFEWLLKAPEANLFDTNGRKVGRHFAGPTWELNNGGKVIGRVKAKVDAPDGKGIPWLLLEAVAANGAIMGNVRSIQRIDTVGGKAPVEPPDESKLDQETRSEYVATYKFYVGKP